MLAVWDEHAAGWVRRESSLRPDLKAWWDSYQGKGEGKPTFDAMPEPYVGDWFNARLVTLGLNPGAAEMSFQACGGHFAEQVRETSYRHWAATDPYGSALWEAENSVNRPRKDGRRVNGYRAARVEFARRWLGEDPAVDGSDVLMLELYPWHSRKVTVVIRPPTKVLDEFIWNPLSELSVAVVFAFGTPWLAAARGLGLHQQRRFERGAFASNSRQAAVFSLPSGQQLAVVWQSGYAGPPGPEDTARLCEMLSA